MNKVVLAYSGGLDTSVAVAWLREQFGVEVVTLTVDVGGGSLREGVERRAMSAGAAKAYVVDARERFVTDFVWPHLQANALYQGAYPLATALARPLIAQLLVEVAAREGADAVAHGCTGKGNDQVRFDVAVHALEPGARGRRPDAGRDGPVARPGDRLRQRARDRDPDHEGVAVLDRRQPVGSLDRDRRPRGPVGRAAGRRLRMDRRAERRSGAGRGRRSPSRAASRSRSTATGSPPVELIDRLHDARRRPRRRPDRPRRGSPGRDQEPRDLRGAGRDDPPCRAPRARGPDAVEGHAPVQPARRRRAGPADLRRAVVQRPPPRPARLRRVVAAGRQRRRPDPARPRHGGRRRTALAAVALRQEPGDLRRGRRVRPRRGRRVHRDLRAAAPGRGRAPRRGRPAPRRRLDVDRPAPRHAADDGRGGRRSRRGRSPPALAIRARRDQPPRADGVRRLSPPPRGATGRSRA